MWNIFHYFFRNFLHGDPDEKVHLGNNEHTSVHSPVIDCAKIELDYFSSKNSNKKLSKRAIVKSFFEVQAIEIFTRANF